MERESKQDKKNREVVEDDLFTEVDIINYEKEFRRQRRESKKQKKRKRERNEDRWN